MQTHKETLTCPQEMHTPAQKHINMHICTNERSTNEEPSYVHIRTLCDASDACGHALDVPLTCFCA